MAILDVMRHEHSPDFEASSFKMTAKNVHSRAYHRELQRCRHLGMAEDEAKDFTMKIKMKGHMYALWF